MVFYAIKKISFLTEKQFSIIFSSQLLCRFADLAQDKLLWMNFFALERAILSTEEYSV
jgi:hypothetical protein